MQATIVNDTERIKMRTYEQIELHSENYTIFDDLSDRDKAIVELFDEFEENYSQELHIERNKIYVKYRDFVEKTRAIHGM